MATRTDKGKTTNNIIKTQQETMKKIKSTSINKSIKAIGSHPPLGDHQTPITTPTQSAPTIPTPTIIQITIGEGKEVAEQTTTTTTVTIPVAVVQGAQLTSSHHLQLNSSNQLPTATLNHRCQLLPPNKATSSRRSRWIASTPLRRCSSGTWKRDETKR